MINRKGIIVMEILRVTWAKRGKYPQARSRGTKRESWKTPPLQLSKFTHTVGLNDYDMNLTVSCVNSQERENDNDLYFFEIALEQKQEEKSRSWKTPLPSIASDLVHLVINTARIAVKGPCPYLTEKRQDHTLKTDVETGEPLWQWRAHLFTVTSLRPPSNNATRSPKSKKCVWKERDGTKESHLPWLFDALLYLPCTGLAVFVQLPHGENQNEACRTRPQWCPLFTSRQPALSKALSLLFECVSSIKQRQGMKQSWLTRDVDGRAEKVAWHARSWSRTLVEIVRRQNSGCLSASLFLSQPHLLQCLICQSWTMTR
jgi:hypothetical protein